MKSFLLFAVILLCLDLSQQLPELSNCPSDFVPAESIADSCGVFTCDESMNLSALGCPAYDCLPEKRLGYREQDNSKPYPECCGGRICAD